MATVWWPEPLRPATELWIPFRSVGAVTRTCDPMLPAYRKDEAVGLYIKGVVLGRVASLAGLCADVPG